MANSQLESKSIFLKDVDGWIDSIVNYVKNNRAKCLDLRIVPNYLTFKPMGVDIQQIIKALMNSAIVEVYLGSRDLNGKIDEFYEVLRQTKIDELNLLQCDLKTDDILKLMNDTKITKLGIISRGEKHKNDSIGEIFSQLANSSVTSLNLSYKSLYPVQNISVISELFSNYQILRLARLKLSGVLEASTDPSSDNPGMNTLINSLRHTCLTHLALERNNLKADSAMILGPVLRRSSLRKINLRGNKIGDSGLDYLLEGMVGSKIVYLNLSRNKIKGNNRLGRFLKKTEIRELNLSGNHIEEGKIFQDDTYSFLKESTVCELKLGSCFRQNHEAVFKPILQLKFSQLDCLDLSNNKLALPEISTLANVLENSSITRLDLHGNKFCAGCYFNLGLCLRKSNLQHIDLSETPESRMTIGALRIFINEIIGSKIVSVVLKNCFIDADVEGIAETVARTSITTLSLRKNSIGGEAAAVLAKRLEKTKIVSLDLGHNHLKDHGAIAVANVLKKTRLRQLYLDFNGIGNDGLQSLAESAKGLDITTMQVSGNPGTRQLLLDQVIWENRKRVLQSAEKLLLEALPTSNPNFRVFSTAANLQIVNTFAKM